MQTEISARNAPAARPRVRSSLNVLALFSSDALEAIFAGAEAFPLHALDGHPRGRVLAIPGWDRGLVADALRGMHASSLWPWEGKSFATVGEAAHGTGTNRVIYPTRRGLFPFRTYVAHSVVDREPCIAIDYDVPSNPARVRTIYDEVRRVDDGLFLGRGMRRQPGRDPKLVLWFGLDVHAQDRPVELGAEKSS